MTQHNPLGGRPKVEIDEGAVERAAAIGCTSDEIAAVIGIGRSTLYDRMKDDPTIQQAMDRGRDTGRATLRRLQWQKANEGSDTMLIWLGKQLLEQRDKSEVDLSGDLNLHRIISEKPQTEDEWVKAHAADKPDAT